MRMRMLKDELEVGVRGAEMSETLVVLGRTCWLVIASIMWVPSNLGYIRVVGSPRNPSTEASLLGDARNCGSANRTGACGASW